jgi:hypothetical protein
MKRTERHHLKENELVLTVARVKESYERYKKPIIAGAIALIVVIAGAVGLFAWRSQTDNQARTLLADALAVERAPVAPAPTPGATTPPAPPPGSYPTEKARSEAALTRFMAVANQFPGSAAGIAARYHAGAMLSALGRSTEAIQRYQEVVDRAGGSIYGEMARLGMADAESQAGQYDKAIAIYKDMAAGRDPKLPVDGILMQLGRTYAAAGKPADAKRTFRRIAEEFAQSPYTVDAKRLADQIKD